MPANARVEYNLPTRPYVARPTSQNPERLRDFQAVESCSGAGRLIENIDARFATSSFRRDHGLRNAKLMHWHSLLIGQVVIISPSDMINFVQLAPEIGTFTADAQSPGTKRP